MSDVYPPEAQKLNVVGHLEELRRRILICLGYLIIISIIMFANGTKLIALVKKPVDDLNLHLIYISPTEVFTSYLKLSLLFGFVICFPVILFQIWAFLAPAVEKEKRYHVVIWILLALVCFVLGISFSHYIALPVAFKFLMSFGGDVAIPYITLSKYISFFSALVLIGGIVFEIPVIIGLLTDIGLLKSAVLKNKRQYAVLVMLILSAILTPTQDIINMLMFALPMIVLYEVGVVISGFIERNK